MEQVELQDVFSGELVTEMASGASTLVSLTPEVVEQVTQGDDEPVFAVYEIESGWSENKRYWPPEQLVSIAEQVNSTSDPVVGYRGHIPLSEDGTAFPEIGIHWLKAVTQISQDKTKLFIKGYALPGTKARDYIKRKLAKAVSVNGKASLKPIKGGVQVFDFDLESIDLARPRKAGMKNRLVAVTQEMESDTVKPEEIAALQENELRAHNPGLVTVIEDKVKKPLEEKVTEMESSVDASKEVADKEAEIRSMLSLGETDDIIEAVKNLLASVKDAGNEMRKRILDTVLADKVKNENTRNVVKRLLVTEMESLDGDEDEEAFKVKVTEMFDSKLEEDDDLKALIESNGAGGGRSVTSTGGRPGKREIKAGYEDGNIKVTKARR